jgi:hypothetical protein
MLMTLLKLAGGAAAVVGVMVALLVLLQDQLIFPRWAMGPSPALPAEAERLEVALPGGDRLVGVRLPAREGGGSGPLILGFGGNGWDADALALFLRALHPGRSVAAFHYRGYRPSTGRPSADAILADALVVHDRLAPEAPEGIVAVGISLGAGPAAHLARHRPLRGAILVTPFDSLEAMARSHYPWAPVRTFLRHRMEVAADLALAEAPAAVITAARDRVVPAARSAPVRAAARDLVFAAEIAEADHNDLFNRPEFAAAMREALAAIEARAAR